MTRHALRMMQKSNERGVAPESRPHEIDAADDLIENRGRNARVGRNIQPVVNYDDASIKIALNC
jgi:hypothetical protein